MSDPISRSDAIGAKPEYRNEDMLDKEKSTYNKGWNDCNDAWVAIIKALPSAVCDDCIWHVCNYNKVDWDAPSAEAVSEDTQTKAELAHIKTRLGNVEKRLQGLILYGGVVR